MKTVLLCLYGLTLLVGPSFSQTLETPSERAVHGSAPPLGLPVQTNVDAEKLVETIFAQYGLKLDPKAWKVYITPYSDETPNARADYRDGIRYIYFNQTFVERMRRTGAKDWALYSVAAHEVGHHLGNHVLRKTLRTEQAEREADYHSGYVLGRMGASYTETVDVLRWLPGLVVSNYPPRSQRLCEIGRGWRDAKNLQQVVLLAQGSNSRQQVCSDAVPDEALFTKRANRDMYGNDLVFDGQVGLPGVDAASCAAQCARRAECKAFSFDVWRGWCFLKTRLVRTREDPSSDLYVKKPSEVPNFDPKIRSRFVSLQDKRFHDQPYEPPRVAGDARECRERCKSSLRCVAFSFLRPFKSCVLFNKTIGHFVDETATSGYKVQETD